MSDTPKTTFFYDPDTGAKATVIRGRPGSGKTYVLLDYAKKAVSGRPVLIVSNELPEEVLWQRIGEGQGAVITVLCDTTIDEVVARLPLMAKERTGFKGLLLVNGIDYFVVGTEDREATLETAVRRLVNEAAKYEVDVVLTMQERRVEQQSPNAPVSVGEA